MTREVSLYLDAIRFLAAITVLAGHLSGTTLTGVLWQAGVAMHGAVIVFFVLSGLVIAYSTQARNTTARDYAVARMARLYSVVVPALLLALVADHIGRASDPTNYLPGTGYVADGQWRQILSALSFTNEIWGANMRILSILPYWSLGCEVIYYVLFGLVLFVKQPWRWPAVGAGLVLAGPEIAMLFPLWLLGVGVWRVMVRGGIGMRPAAALWAASVAVSGAYLAWLVRGGGLHVLFPFQVLGGQNVADDYFVGGLFAANLIGFQGIAPLVGPALMRMARPIRWCAGATFSIYLVHLPLALCIAAVVPWRRGDWRSVVAIYVGTLVGVFVFAQFTERRKEPWRRAIAWGMERVLPVRAGG